MDLFKLHPSYNVKKGVGIGRIKVVKTKYGNNQFEIVRIDGSTTDISYLKCLNGNGTDISEINKACRNAIVPIIKEFKEKNVVYGVTKCPFFDIVLTKENTHIDHYNLRFTDVFKKWIAEKDIEEVASKLNIGSKDNEIEVYFTDKSIINDFIEFHNKNTNLRAVSSNANSTILTVNLSNYQKFGQCLSKLKGNPYKILLTDFVNEIGTNKVDINEIFDKENDYTNWIKLAKCLIFYSNHIDKTIKFDYDKNIFTIWKE